MANIEKRNERHHSLSPFSSLQKEMDKALHGFYDFFETRPFHFSDFENLTLAPSMDLVEDENSYKLEVEMPGMDEKDIKISINDNLLTVRGEKSASKKDSGKNYIAREIYYGKYERSLTLPQAADGDKATASFKKGMLWVTIPKKSQGKGKGHDIAIEKA